MPSRTFLFSMAMSLKQSQVALEDGFKSFYHSDRSAAMVMQGSAYVVGALAKAYEDCAMMPSEETVMTGDDAITIIPPPT